MGKSHLHTANGVLGGCGKGFNIDCRTVQQDEGWLFARTAAVARANILENCFRDRRTRSDGMGDESQCGHAADGLPNCFM